MRGTCLLSQTSYKSAKCTSFQAKHTYTCTYIRQREMVHNPKLQKNTSGPKYENLYCKTIVQGGRKIITLHLVHMDLMSHEPSQHPLSTCTQSGWLLPIKTNFNQQNTILRWGQECHDEAELHVVICYHSASVLRPMHPDPTMKPLLPATPLNIIKQQLTT